MSSRKKRVQRKIELSVPNSKLIARNSPTIFVTGPSGAGKTTLARALAKQLGYRFLSVDAIRDKNCGDTRAAWLKVWRCIRFRQRVVVDASGASRIFRLIVRVRSYGTRQPLVVRLIANRYTLDFRNKAKPRRMAHSILLSAQQKLSADYLVEATKYVKFELLIDTDTTNQKAVLHKVLAYMRHRNS
jgi:predicted kinase